MIPLVDRSHLNAPYPLAKLAEHGIAGCWFKVAQYITGEDKQFNASWQEAKKTSDFLRGGYYFFDPRYDGTVQAKQFLSFGINFTAPGCMGGCVDVEDLVVFTDSKVDTVLTAAANKWVADNWQLGLQRLKDFLAYYKEQVGEDCTIYSYNGYMKEYYHSPQFSDNKMFISSLQPNCPKRYDTGNLPEYWQNTYNWNGTDMDGDFYTGTMDELRKLANITIV